MSREEIAFGGLFNSLDASRIPRGRAYSLQNCTVDRGVVELGPRYRQLGARTSANAGDVGWGLGYGRYGANAIFRLSLTGVPTGGTFSLEWRPDTGSSWVETDAIAWNATAETVQDALLALEALAPGDLIATGGPLPNAPINLEIRGRYSVQDVPPIRVKDNDLTGTLSPAPDIAIIQPGGLQEEFLAVVQHSGQTTAVLYSVDPDTGTYTEVATGLSPTDWRFVQYGRRLYAVNVVDGLQYKEIGGVWSGTTGTASVPAPRSVLLASGATPTPPSMFPSVTISDSSGWGGSGPTVGSIFQNTVQIALHTTITNADVMLELTLNAAVDLTNHDAFLVQMEAATGEVEFDATTIGIQFISDEATPTTVEPLFRTAGTQIFNSWSAARRIFQFASEERAARGSIIKIVIRMRIRTGTTGKTFSLAVQPAHAWMNDASESLQIEDGPTREAIEYTYTLYDPSTGAESSLSQRQTQTALIPSPSIFQGCWVYLTLRNTEPFSTTAYRFRVYRRVEGQWRRIYEAAYPSALGVANFYDKLMIDEARALDSLGAVQLPNGTPADSAGVFKQSFVVLGALKAWFSAVGLPLSFAPDPDDPEAPSPNTDDEGRPRTVYVADDRGESALAVVGQDSCYLVGPSAVYAMVGDLPAELTPPRRLPGSRGALGGRASCASAGGVLVGALDGLYFYSVSRGSADAAGALVEREETSEVRQSWSELVGSSAAGMVVVQGRDDIWALNGAKFLRFSRSRQVETGTFAASVKAAAMVQTRGLYFLDSRGRMMAIGADQTSDAGTAATWTYTTGTMSGPRTKIKGIEMHAEGRPRLTVEIDEGDGFKAAVFDAPNVASFRRYPLSIFAGHRFRVTLSGGASDRVLSLSFEVEGATGSKS